MWRWDRTQVGSCRADGAALQTSGQKAGLCGHSVTSRSTCVSAEQWDNSQEVADSNNTARLFPLPVLVP